MPFLLFIPFFVSNVTQSLILAPVILEKIILVPIVYFYFEK
jgi:hypothetical protein